MSTARDKLIADWRRRLDAAEAEPVASSPRRAWLVRVRTRLYRFLLSLYGDGTWRACQRPSPRQTEPVIFDSPGAEALAGKPARDLGKIRSVLKSVANNQDHRPEAGSLTADEVIAGCWFVVAAASANLDLIRCMDLLHSRGIQCRMQCFGDDHVIEVWGPTRHEAIDLIDENRQRLRKKWEVGARLGGAWLVRSPLKPKANHLAQQVRLIRQSEAPITTMALLFILPLVCFVPLMFLAAFGPGARPASESLRAYGLAVLGTTVICCLATVWAIVWSRLSRKSASR
jgi:hypothetical protein